MKNFFKFNNILFYSRLWFDEMLNFMQVFRLFFFLFSGIITSCGKNTSAQNESTFDSIPLAHPLVPMLNEISGIADSKNNPGKLWGIEDSGNPPVLYLIGHTGQVISSVYIKGVSNRDWEEMALFEGEIYIAETGDNALQFSNYSLYKFAEPLPGADTVFSVERIRFTYPSGPKDSEAFLIDPGTRDIHFITKNENPSRVYTLKYPYDTNTIHTLLAGNELGFGGVVAATISPDGKDILVKTYTAVYRYPRKSGESIVQALTKQPSNIPYKMEPQGEAIGFSLSNSGFFTLSEKGFSSQVHLYFYPRK
jgi:hypothetical protein